MPASGPGHEPWDSDAAWSDARARTRDEVRAAFAPRPRTCPNCGNEETTAARTCSRCGAPFVAVLEPGMSLRAKKRVAAAAVAAVVVLGAAAAVIVPGVQSDKRDASARSRAEAKAALARERHRLELDQRLHSATAPAGELPARMRSRLEASITADARARVRAHTLQGPILRTECTAVSGAGGPPVGKYTCVAVNNEILRGTRANAGSLGYPFWARVDFRHRSYAWCKINPQAGEGSATPSSVRLSVPVPRGCDINR